MIRTTEEWEPQIGEAKTFLPYAVQSDNGSNMLESFGMADPALRVTGRIVYVNTEHRYVRVEYPTAYGPAWECFKY